MRDGENPDRPGRPGPLRPRRRRLAGPPRLPLPRTAGERGTGGAAADLDLGRLHCIGEPRFRGAVGRLRERDRGGEGLRRRLRAVHRALLGRAPGHRVRRVPHARLAQGRREVRPIRPQRGVFGDDRRLSGRLRGGEVRMTPFDRMVLGVGIVFFTFKALTARRLAFARTVAYWTMWPGMDARPFTATTPSTGLGLLAWGALKMAAGAALLLVHVGIEAVDI